ncbi:ras-related protein Rab-20 isoform X4 [Lutra lutra]|uniref:ras-related protein Rab-20 isoform X4 n=1 Tax=Lutra lutra TaxID=9657 RepID=UPI001FD2CCC7|nr:ras-related protein Rab-20 isoform X4 [Lutra lutra]
MRKPDGKIVLLGDMNVGKTSLLHRYMERRFPDTVSTVGGAFYLKQWRSYNISIWDTAGGHTGAFVNSCPWVFQTLQGVLRVPPSRHLGDSVGGASTPDFGAAHVLGVSGSRISSGSVLGPESAGESLFLCPSVLPRLKKKSLFFSCLCLCFLADLTLRPIEISSLLLLPLTLGGLSPTCSRQVGGGPLWLPSPSPGSFSVHTGTHAPVTSWSMCSGAGVPASLSFQK